MKQSDKSAGMPGTPDKAGSAGKAKFIGTPRYIGKADPAKAKSGSRPDSGRSSRLDRPSYGDRPGGDRPHTSGRPGYAGRTDRPSGDRPSFGGRPSGDRPHTSSRPGYAGRADRPSGDRPSFGDRPSGDRPSFGDRPSGDRPHTSSRPGYAGRADRPSGDRPSFGGRPSGDRPHTSSRPSNTGRTDRPGNTGRTDRPSGDRTGYAGKAKRFEKPNTSGHPSFVGKFKVSGKPEFAENSTQAEFTEKPANLDKIMPAVPMAGPEQSIQRDITVDEASAGSPDRLEGRNPILEALKAGRTINKLWVAKREDKPDPNLGRLITQAREAGAVIMEVDRRVLDQMSETHGHQGVIAQVAAHEYVELAELVTAVRERQETPFLLILSEIQESYNLGSILRIADAAGVHGVVIPQRRAVGLDAAVAKASAGAIEHVPVCRVTNLSQTIESLKEQGFWIAGTDSEGTVSYEKADWQGPLAILIGSEGEGISPVLRQHCDFLISIPMQGHVNSLNAAVAAGVVVFEAARQRREKSSERA